jgi:hypothetical protein
MAGSVDPRITKALMDGQADQVGDLAVTNHCR